VNTYLEEKCFERLRKKHQHEPRELKARMGAWSNFNQEPLGWELEADTSRDHRD